MPKQPTPQTRYQAGWMSDLDGRTAIAQDMRQRWRALTDDLGGADRLSYAQRSLVERALWLEFWLAQQEQELAGGGDFDVARWVQACNSLQGVLGKLGLERRARDVPTLHEYIQAKGSS